MKEQTSGSQTNAQRRVIAGLLTGGGMIAILPTSWTQPVLRAVVLPTHAQTTSDPTPPPPPPEESPPLIARLNGVVNGSIGTEFTVDAGASTGSDGAVLTFNFKANHDCTFISQNGATAVIRRNLIAGTCTVEVTVSDGSRKDTDTATASVTGAPPDPP